MLEQLLEVSKQDVKVSAITKLRTTNFVLLLAIDFMAFRDNFDQLFYTV